MYYREPCTPAPLDLNLIAVVTHLARIAIERDVAERERQHLLAQLASERSQLTTERQRLSRIDVFVRRTPTHREPRDGRNGDVTLFRTILEQSVCVAQSISR